MTSISQQAVLSPQVPSSLSQSVAQVQSPPLSTSGTSSPQVAAQAAAPGRSYANATKKPSANNSTSAQVVGGLSYAKADSISPVNGKPNIPPAVPTLGTPTIVNGNNAVNTASGSSDHSRKVSVTINAQGASGHMPNGGPSVGKPAGIRFGSASPAMAHSTVHPSDSLAVGANPRITSPATSPSPIPQPPASGGRPPSGLQGQGTTLNFGSMGGEDPSRQYRSSMASGSLTPAIQPQHLRRDSSQSSHGDMNNINMGHNAGRGGYPHQGGRGRGYGPYTTQQMPYSPNTVYRGAPNHPRGGPNMGQQFQQQGRQLAAPYPSPHQSARSPNLPHAQPIAPQAGQMPMPSPQMAGSPYGLYAQPMGPPQNQYGMHPGFDPYTGSFYPPSPYLSSPLGYLPTSPRPAYGLPSNPQPPYGPGSYPQQPPSMSGTSSAVADRTNVTPIPSQTPLTPAVSQPVTTSGGANSPAPKSSNFQIPVRKSAGIRIVDPNSGAVKTFDKRPTSPAPPSKSPAIVSSTPTPPPSEVNDAHQKSQSKSVKTDEEKINEMKDAVAKKKLEAEREEQLKKDEAEALVLKEKQEVEAKRFEEQKAAEAKAAQEAEDAARADAEAAAAEEAEQASQTGAVIQTAPEEVDEEAEDARKRQEEEEYWARIEEEAQREEREEREREEKYQKKKAEERAEKARKEAEAAARADEEMKQAEREAEAAEEAREKRLAEEAGQDREQLELFAKLKKPSVTPQSAASPAAETPAEQSGAATPVSDTSMPPPSRERRTGKMPAALKLETTKAVEAPQPSAALQSLRSARFLQTISDVQYPPAIASPNPALNTSAPMGKFRYDKNFLMQFQTVFVEKPSETWSEKVKETVGDTSETPASARGGSSRSGGMMTSRQPSNRPNVISGAAFAGGAFGAFQGAGGRTLPPGTTSASRFEASTQAAQRQPPQISFGGNRGGFPVMSQPLARTASSTSLAHPHSPRNNPSQRGGRGSNRGKPQRENEQDAKKYPLTQDKDIELLPKSKDAWTPQSNHKKDPLPDGYLTPDIVQRKVKGALNKLTPENFDKITNQILEIVAQSKKETDGRTLRQVIQLTFEKATDEAHWAQMYAQFCSRMLQFMTPEIKDETLPLDKNGKVNAGGTLFRKYLLNRCQQDFEAGWKDKLPKKPEGEMDQTAMLSDEYYIAAAAKRRGLGLVRFIGELFKLGMLTSRIMHMCVKRLVDWEGLPDEAEVESLTSLLRTIGENLDSEEKMRPTMDAYFDRINSMVNADGLPSRLRFMLMDVVDLRKKDWKTKGSAVKGPVTLEEVRQQAQSDREKADAQRAADSGRQRGSGRMNLGRGDARNFSGGGPNMPPPDYQRNTVGIDELRRLGNRGGSRQASSQGAPAFAPTSMFGANRGSNTRRNLGPGGGLVHKGEESGASSRTGTPPAGRERKEKDEKDGATHANAFGALAELDSGETADHPTSPPSTASSPPVTSLRTLEEQQRSKLPPSQAKDADSTGNDA